MVEPTTRSCRKKIRLSSVADGFGPGRRARDHDGAAGLAATCSECDQVAAPTVSITASTRSGSRAPDANACVRAELERPRLLRLVAAGRPDAQPGGRPEPDQRGRDAAAGTLHQHACRRARAPDWVKSIR